MLRAGALAALAGPLLASCLGETEPPAPDPLAELAAQARSDAAAARAVASAHADLAEVATLIAQAREEHATALQQEVDRERPPTTSSTAPGSTAPAPSAPPSAKEAEQALTQALASAEQRAAGLVPSVPAYRAGLLGSVASGCASLRDVLSSTELTSAAPGTPGTLSPEAVDGLQQALAAEHEAVWAYGLAAAFLTSSAGQKAVDEGVGVHQGRREANERLVKGAGATPRVAEPAYVPPEQVTNATSAAAMLATVEADGCVAWRGVLERTDDGALRGIALAALTDAAVRATRWRVAAGQSPATPAFPGKP